MIQMHATVEQSPGCHLYFFWFFLLLWPNKPFLKTGQMRSNGTGGRRVLRAALFLTFLKLCRNHQKPSKAQSMLRMPLNTQHNAPMPHAILCDRWTKLKSFWNAFGQVKVLEAQIGVSVPQGVVINHRWLMTSRGATAVKACRGYLEKRCAKVWNAWRILKNVSILDEGTGFHTNEDSSKLI